MYGSGLFATELAATGTSGFGGVPAAGGGACPPCPASVVAAKVNATSAMLPTVRVVVVERRIKKSSLIRNIVTDALI
jgi:hypothetical protein